MHAPSACIIVSGRSARWMRDRSAPGSADCAAGTRSSPSKITSRSPARPRRLIVWPRPTVWPVSRREGFVPASLMSWRPCRYFVMAPTWARRPATLTLHQAAAPATKRQGGAKSPDRPGGVLGARAICRLRRGRRRPPGMGNPIQPRALFPGASGADASRKACHPAASSRGVTPMSAITRTYRRPEVNLDETQQHRPRALTAGVE